MPPESGEVRAWLVERGYTDRDLVILKYATLEGNRVYRKEIASQALGAVTAAKDVSADDLGTVEEPDLQERYAAEAKRMESTHDPDDVV